MTERTAEKLILAARILEQRGRTKAARRFRIVACAKFRQRTRSNVLTFPILSGHNNDSAWLAAFVADAVFEGATSGTAAEERGRIACGTAPESPHQTTVDLAL
jgi:hypothetical protein